MAQKINNRRLEEQVNRFGLTRKLTWPERFLKFGGRDATVLFAGGIALIFAGVLSWGIGASWLVSFIDGFATAPDKRVGWLGFPIQLVLTIMELSIMLKLKDNPRWFWILMPLLVADAGTNTFGILAFLLDLIHAGKIAVLALPVLWLLVTLLAAFFTYGPEKLVTIGFEMLPEGYSQLALCLETVRLSIELDEYEERAEALAQQQQSLNTPPPPPHKRSAVSGGPGQIPQPQIPQIHSRQRPGGFVINWSVLTGGKEKDKRG